MSQSNADRNLLLGILALQMDFINRDALIAAMQGWVFNKAQSLGQLLLEQGKLNADEHALLEALVKKHLERHGDNAERSLAAVSSVGSLREDLKQIADAELQVSVAHTVAFLPQKEDPFPTLPSVGISTSSGLRFRILRPHARGGLGQVYVAHDVELSREVALKEIQDRFADHPESRSRFLLEAEITGGLEHPGIVPVYGLGQYADGRPFYAMRFIKGDSLSEAVRRFHEGESRGKDPGERTLLMRKLLGRFIDVCNAISYAHSRGVLHRDLKPGNIMLGKYGETLVVDWGLAKPLGYTEGSQVNEEQPLQPASAGASAETVSGSAVGTPQYMSPEQAAGRLDLLGRASDVYSLGATLYCLLTGRAPFPDPREISVGEVLQKVQRGDFPPPRRLRHDLDPALEAICLKAMALRPEDRYSSPRSLAEDVEHWLADEPVTAYAEPWTARLARWVRHHTGLVGVAAAGSVVAVTVTIAAVLVDSANRQEVVEKQRAEQQRQHAEQMNQLRGVAERLRFDADMNLVQRAWQENQVPRMVELLERYQTRKAGEPDLPGFEWYYLWRLCHSQLVTLQGHTDRVMSVAYSPDGKYLASGSHDETVKIWEAASGREVLTLTGHTGAVLSVAFSPDGRQLASASADQTVRLWDLSRGQAILTLAGHSDSVYSVAFSPDGARLASAGSDRNIKVWDAATGKEVLTLPEQSDYVTSVAFSPDGRLLASAGWDQTVKVWNATTGQAVLTLQGHADAVWGLAFSPDGRRLASASADRTVKVWDLAGAKAVLDLRGHSGSVESVAFSPDGRRLASASADRTVKVWDADSGQKILDLQGHTASVECVTFSPDGTRFASASVDRTVKVWNATPGQEPLTLRGHLHGVYQSVFSPDGRRLASASADHTVKVWDATSGQAVATLQGHTYPVYCVAFSPDGNRLASGGADNTVKVWDWAAGQAVLTLQGHSAPVRWVAFSPDGSRLASAGFDHTVKVWDLANGKVILNLMGHTDSVFSVAFSPDGTRLVSGGGDGMMMVWDLASGRAVLTVRAHATAVDSVAFSPDGTRLATSGGDETVKVWDAVTGQLHFTLQGHTDPVFCVTYSPDGTRLASASADKTVRVWDAASGQEVLALAGHAGAVFSVAFSPDGRRLASASPDKTIKVWNAEDPKSEARAPGREAAP